jgi:hypothetical protein
MNHLYILVYLLFIYKLEKIWHSIRKYMLERFGNIKVNNNRKCYITRVEWNMVESIGKLWLWWKLSFLKETKRAKELQWQ